MKKNFYMFLVLLLLSGCAAPAGQEGPVSPSNQTRQEVLPDAASQKAQETAVIFTDDLGQELAVEPPKRVAALIGSFADIWILAGGEDSLIAAANDAWASFDLPLENAENLGLTTAPNLELLLSVQPDLILASCNTAADLDLRETFREAGLTAAYFDVETIEDYLRMLEICTALTGCRENYELYGTLVFAQVQEAVQRQDGSSPSVLYVRASGSSCKVKGSQGSVLGEMLADLGCLNVADREGSLLEDLSLEAILAADPDYIFAVLQGADAAKAQEVLDGALLAHPAWKSLRAVEEGRFYTLDSRLYNLKPNARWGEAYEQLADILYPS